MNHSENPTRQAWLGKKQPYDSGYDLLLKVNLQKGTEIMKPRRVWSLFGKKGGGTEVRVNAKVKAEQYEVLKSK